MPTEAEKAVYPLAASGGVAIPFDIGYPLATFFTSFVLDTVSAQKTLNAEVLNHVAILYADQDVLVRFGAIPDETVDTYVSDQLIVLRERPTAIIIPDVLFKTRGITASGTLWIQILRRWQALEKEVATTGLL